MKLSMIRNNRKIILLMAFLVMFLGASLVYSKKIKASTIEQDFKKQLNNSEYDAASKVYKEISNDIILEKYFNLKNNIKEILTSELSSVKQQYLDEKISSEYAVEKLNEYNKLEVLNKNEVNAFREAIKAFENSRDKYKQCEKLFENKNYISCLNSLPEINEEDKLYYDKGVKLKEDATSGHINSIDENVKKLSDSNKYEEAKTLLNKNKDFFEPDIFNSTLEEVDAEKEQYMKNLEIIRDQLINDVEKTGNEALTAFAANYEPSPKNENFVNKSALSSGSNFLIWVNLKEQKTNVFIGKKGKWKLIKSCLSSTGAPGKETPSGTFTVKGRGTWFFSSKYGQGGKYWVQFWGNYLFHSLPMDKNKNVVDSTLGKAASHGCVRLSIEDASWIYNNIPGGTTVYIK